MLTRAYLGPHAQSPIPVWRRQPRWRGESELGQCHWPVGGSAGSLSQWVLGLVGHFSPVWGPGRGQGRIDREGRSWFCGPGADEEGETQKFHVKVRPWAAWLQTLCT